MRTIVLLLVLVLLPLYATAGSDPSVEDVLTGSNPSLTPQEQAGLAQGEQGTISASAPVAGANGFITFP
mgnify:CR=1 FL=1